MSMQSTIVLNANQRRHFEVLFARLEDALARVETLLATEPRERNRLSLIRDDLPPAFLENAPRVLSDLRSRIVQLATHLDLQPQTLSRSRAIAATLGAESIRLQESLSAHLHGYGPVHESVVEHLDPVLKRMARTIADLANTLQPGGGSSRRE